MDQEQEEQNFDDAFDELAGGGSSGERSSSMPARDDLGRFASKEEATEEQPAVQEQAEETDSLNNDETSQENIPDKQPSINWEHRYKSDLGRQNALQSKITELEAANAQLRNNPPASSEISDEGWEDLKKDFPEIANAFENKLNNVVGGYEQQIKQLQDQINPIQQHANDQYIDSQYDLLGRDFPQWKETINTTDFNDWLQNQPSSVQEFMGSDNAADAAYLLKSYGMHESANNPKPESELRLRRKAQLENSQTIGGGNGLKKTAELDDFDSAFDEFASK